MNVTNAEELNTGESRTRIERKSDCELVVTRTVDAPVHLVYRAWTEADLFRQWWIPKSYGLNLVSCKMDVRVGGEYRLAFLHEGATMEFFGTYLEVDPNARLVWTNDEGDAGQTVTTVTFSEQDGQTHLTVHNLYPSKEALEGDGATGAMPEAFGQLDELLAELVASAS